MRIRIKDDIERVYNTILSYIEETEALPDEIKSIKKAKKDKDPLISHDDFWNSLLNISKVIFGSYDHYVIGYYL